ncbi:MAG: prolipoprotein diacylglyceryl transferase [Rhodospirillaceae bacterium]|nr:prolipoprotein diacylglyceryl transferase [Alphaproteobacteria bacterium]MBR73061.1 prolipoprotein diacylglyceryl transferase [Rhodospirillaceae bacterium]
MTPAIVFPTIDPVLLEVGPISIRWYALAYLLGLLLGWQYLRYLARKALVPLNKRQVDDLLVISAIAIIIGGRLGYVFFYQPSHYFENLEQIPMIWTGGMSFHGGLVGMILGLIFFSWKLQKPILQITDGIALCAPIGLFFGRIANFINGELFGKASNVPWAVIFPTGNGLARHPSQLYEALLEGLILFIILNFVAFSLRGWSLPGLLSGIFLIGYGISRITVEFFREPDISLGYLFWGMTMGQILTIPMLCLGIAIITKHIYKGIRK